MPLKRKEENQDQELEGTKKVRTKVDREIIELCQQIYDSLRNYHNEDGRLLCETFIRLPTKRANLEYYNVVKHPIDLLRIQNKIKTEEYQKFEEFDDDINLVIMNAKQYYKKTSQEYKDAIDLWEFYHEKKKQLAEAFTQRKVDESNPISAIISKPGRKRSLASNQKYNESIDEDDVETEATNKKSKKKAKLNKNNEDNDGDESEPENLNDENETKSNTGSVEETVNVKKKRSFESDLSENNNEMINVKKANNISAKNMKAQKNTTNLNEYLEDYFDVICSCQDGSRYIANIFHLLPSHKDYPDYYEIIKYPIDLKTIAKKILNFKYKSLDEMEQDLILMINNAKRYNDPKSQLYKDAQFLKRVITNTRQELEQAMKNNRTYGVKSREKKHTIVLEIAELEGDEGNNNDEEEDDDGDDGDDDDDSNLSNDEIDDSNENQQQQQQQDSGDESVINDDDNILWTLYMYVKNYRHSNQTLIDPFLKLPNKRFYPDYYEEIKKPIALNHIRTNLRKSKYSTLKDLYKDIDLMFKNAMSYNREDSAIYINAKRLRNAATAKFNELEQKNSSNDQQRSTNKSSKKNLFSHKIQRLYKLLTDYCEFGRNLSKSFLNLPLCDEQPDYYKIIKDPIDLEQVRKNIENNFYKTESEMINDCMRVFENAKVYYKSGSQMYNDAQALQKYLSKRYEIYLNRGGGSNATTTSGLSNTIGDSNLTSTLSISNNSFFNMAVPTVTAPNPSYAQLDLKEKMLIIYNYINDYKEEGTKRELAAPFKHLPSKLEYPDYYNVIKKPIDLTKIYNKIVNGHYATCEDMILDYAQLFENACIYNEPGSQIYKDALLLQKLVFFKRIEVDTNLNDDVYTICDINAAVQEILLNLFEATFNYQDSEGRKLSDSFLELFNKSLNITSILNEDGGLLTFQSIKQNLLLNLYKRLDSFQDDMFKMFEQTRKIFNKKSQIYKDSIDLQVYFINKRDELCKKGEILQSNAFSYGISSLEEDDTYVADTNSNEESILNDILQIDYLNKLKEKFNSELNLEQKQTILFGDENFKLDCNDFIYLKKFQRSFEQDHLKSEIGYNEENTIACVLAIGCEKSSSSEESMEIENTEMKPIVDTTKYKLLVQLYLKPTDIHGHKHKYISNEVFKSDIYEIIDLDQIIKRKCHVISIKDYISYSIEYGSSSDLQQIYLCESIYSTRDRLFRKVKKWQTNSSSSSTSSSSSLSKLNSLTYDLDRIKFQARSFPIVVTRSFLNSNEINDITCDSKCKNLNEKHKLNVLLSQSQATAIQENENYIYYEQIFYNKNQCLKLGDFVYIKQRLNEKNELVPALITQLPFDIEDGNKSTIIRIDRLWRVRAQNDPIQQSQLIDQSDYSTGTMFYIKGPVFLRPIDIYHEPTRLFYKNEVFKDNDREFATIIDEICGKCAVLSMKKYVSSRQTEINENDVYICETKYVSQQKNCRKFAKGLKKFELSHKCYEDEIYFFKKELRLRKYLSPLLFNEKLLMFTINNAISNSNIIVNKSIDFHMDDDTNSNSMISNDYMNNNTSAANDGYNMNTSTCSSTLATPGKTNKASQLNHLMSSAGIDKDKMANYRVNKSGKLVRKRVKRSKKCGYNIFSKEYRKKLRDEHSTLTFIEMSREVGNHWRLLTDAQRAAYEERAKEESIKEAAKMAQAAAAAEEKSANENKIKAQQLQLQQQQQQQILQQQQLTHNVPSNGQHINQIFATQNNIIKQPSQQQQPTIIPQNPSALTPNNGSQYSIINVAPSNAVQLNLNYGQNTAYIIKQPNQAIQLDQNGAIQINDYIQRANPPEQQQQQVLSQQQQYVQKQQQQNKPIFVSCPQKSTRPLHTEAYMRYIDRLKRNQETSQRWQFDSHSLLDIRPSHIRESNMTAAPTNWIENIPTGDVFKHLVSLRYYLLNDTVNIKRHEIYNEGEIEETEDAIHLDETSNQNHVQALTENTETPMDQEHIEQVAQVME